MLACAAGDVEQARGAWQAFLDQGVDASSLARVVLRRVDGVVDACRPAEHAPIVAEAVAGHGLAAPPAGERARSRSPATCASGYGAAGQSRMVSMFQVVWCAGLAGARPTGNAVPPGT